MKNNTMKRVLAGTLAVLTVAAYVPANVGGFIQVRDSIVANARDIAIESTTKPLAGAIEKGDYFEGDTTLNKANNDNITYNVTLAADQFENDGDAKSKAADGISTGDVIINPGNVASIQNVTSIAYTSTDDSGNAGAFLRITASATNYYLKMVNNTGDTYANFCKDHFIRVTGVNYASNVVTYTLGVETAAPSVNIDYGNVSDYLQSIAFTNRQGAADTANIVSSTSVAVKYKTMVTIKSTAKLMDSQTPLDEFITGYENGVFTYEFNALDGRTLALEKATLMVDGSADGVTGTDKATAYYQLASQTEKTVLPVKAVFEGVTNPTGNPSTSSYYEKDSEGKYKKSTDSSVVSGKTYYTKVTTVVEDADTPTNVNAVNIPVGALVTITSPTMFTIANGQITGLDDENGLVTDDVSAVYEDGVFTATFNFSGVQAVIGDDKTDKYSSSFVDLAAFPKDLQYTITKNVITANTTDGKTIKNAEVANAFAETWVPEYKANATTQTEDDIKVDANGNKVYTKTKLAEGASVAFNKDSNATVKLNFTVDNVLTGKSGTSAGANDTNQFWKVTLTKDNKVLGTLSCVSTAANNINTLKFVPKKTDGTDDIPLTATITQASQTVNGETILVSEVNNDTGIVTALEALGFKIESFTDSTTYYSVSSSGLVIENRNAGVYKAELTVWDASNDANSKTATYNWTISPATDVTEEDVVFAAYYSQKYTTLEQDAGQAAVNAGDKAVDVANQNYDDEYKKNHDNVIPNSTDEAYSEYMNGKTRAANLAYEEAYQEAYADFIKENQLPIAKNSDGVYVVSAEEEKLTDNSDTVILTATLKDDTQCTFAGGNILGVMDTTETATLQVIDANYNVPSMAIKWSLAEKAVEDSIYFNAKQAGYIDSDIKHVNASGTEGVGAPYEMLTCSFENLEDVLKNCLFATNDVDASKATFKYTKGQALDDEIVDIDALTSGLPALTDLNDTEKTDYEDTTSTTGVKIFVYATVGSCETAKPICINLKNQTATIAVYPILAKTTFTYGETIQPEDIAFVKTNNGTDVNTKELVTGLTPVSIQGITIKRIKDADGNAVTSDADVIYSKVWDETKTVNAVSSTGLIPGTYTAVITTADNSDGTLTGNDTDAVTLSNDDKKLYTCQAPKNDLGQADLIKALTTTFTVEKKPLDPSMVGVLTMSGGKLTDVANVEVPIVSNQAQLTDAILNGTDSSSNTKKVHGVKIAEYDSSRIQTVEDIYQPITVKINGGTASATKPGKNAAKISPTGDSAKLYTGTCDAPWYATEGTGAGFTLERDKKADNVYQTEKDGVMIHFEGKLNITDFDEETATPTAIANKLKELKITKFGKLVAKNGEFARDADRNEVARGLRLDSGISTIIATNGTKTGSNGLITGLNSRVSSLDDYLWEVTYAVTETGYVVYDVPRMIDFETTAAQVVDPRLSKTQLVQKNDNLYYYGYATKKSKTAEDNAKVIEPTFGVVVSRTGNYATVPDDYAKKLFNATLNTYCQDENAIVTYVIEIAKEAAEDRKVDLVSKQLKAKLASGIDDARKKTIKEVLIPFAEEVEKTAVTLSVDNCDVSSKAVANNSNYTEDECGTLVRIADSKSNVYMATYTDYGQGMVALSNVKLIESASATIAAKVDLRTFENLDTSTKKYYMQARRSSDVLNQKINALATFTTAKGKQQTFEPIEFALAAGTNDVDKTKMFTEFGLNITKTGGNTVNVMSKQPNANTVTGTGAPDNNTTIAFGAVTASDNDGTSAQAYGIYKGITIYAPNTVQRNVIKNLTSENDDNTSSDLQV